ncbi:zinc finger MYM-type protein 1-like [Triticum urartu]|uniref:zinc finger MYM-type protein 1-like n=1 Tax=Triticum urartu TaxID=4572 RepID=UPI002042DA45|nr:zinc finger MYM-type protein 1-like [Triticum urartu]
MKKKGVTIFEMWDKSSKTRKITPTSTPTSLSVEVESNLQLALVQRHDEAPQPERETTPIVEDDEAVDEDDESMPQFEADLAALERDPSKRLPISSYHANDQDRVRRRYIDLGACQPKDHKFEIRDFSGHPRRFCPTWFKDYKWLEYSVQEEAAFCFVCYLFKDKTKSPGGDAFVNGGFNNWNLKARLKRHIGAVSSAHAEAQEKYDMFTTPTTSIRESIASNTTQYKVLYKLRVTWTLKCLRFLLHQGLAFRGHDESDDSLNKGNFLELLNWLAGNFEEVDRVVLKNAPQNCKMACHDIQQELIKCCAQLTTKLVIEDLDGGHFAVLADESSDMYQNEQLAVCLRYVDKKGRTVVRFLGLAHVEDTSSLTLKAAIEDMLMAYNFSFVMVRGQGYDGASNMKGNANGMKKLIMDESPYAYYVHCFAHQLQLTLVAVAKESGDCNWFFQQLACLLNVLGYSCKKMRMLRIAQAEELIAALELEEVETGTGLNQEMGIGRPCDTRWGSHYKTVNHVISMYPAIRRVLIRIAKEYNGTEAVAAMTMLTSFRTFEFVFMAHLMQEIFEYTDDLSRALQKKRSRYC